jgi:hypothetical protein
MYIVFYNTNDVFIAEEKIASQQLNVEVVPTPVQDKAYCGVCVQVDNNDIEKTRSILLNMDYIEVEDE